MNLQGISIIMKHMQPGPGPHQLILEAFGGCCLRTGNLLAVGIITMDSAESVKAQASQILVKSCRPAEKNSISN